MALLDASSSKGTMSGGPTLFGLPIKQASLITVCFTGGTVAVLPL